MNNLENSLSESGTINQESNRANALTQDRYVPLKECDGIVKEAYKMVGDSRFQYEKTNYFKYFVNRAANQLSKYGNASRKLINTITEQLEYYRLIVKINSKLSNEFRTEITNVLNEVHDTLVANKKNFAGEFDNSRKLTSRSAGGYKANINRSINDIEEGKYIIPREIYAAQHAIESLNTIGIDTSNLKVKIDKVEARIIQAGGYDYTSWLEKIKMLKGNI
jgi:hypothetical protein